MSTRTPNYQLFQNQVNELISEISFNYQNDNMTLIDNALNNIQTQATSLQNQLNSITTTPAPTEQEIQIARNGYATLLESILNAGINKTTSDPSANDTGYTFWLNTLTSKLYVFKGGALGSYEWEQVDNNYVFELIQNALDTEIILNETNLVESHTPNFSGGVETKIEGKFLQNFIDTHKCIYRMEGDTTSPIPIDITDNSMKVMSYSTGYIGCGCYVGVRPNAEYTIKANSVDSIDIYIYDADGLTKSNRTTKRITGQNNQNIDFKFTTPSSGYVFITFTKHGSDTNGTIASNILMIEGDYTNKNIEWVKGVQPSIPAIDISTPSNNKSSFKLNDWLGEDEVYENGLINKYWGRVLLSEAYEELYESIVDLGNVYRFYVNFKNNYSGHSGAPAIVDMYFKDFLTTNTYSDNYKHLYGYYQNNKNKILIFIPKAEIDALTGSNLEEKFERWLEENDDYVYYKKANIEQMSPVKIGLLTTFENELNTFNISSNTVIPSSVTLKIKENLKKATGQQNNNVQQSVVSLEELNNLILTKEYLNYDANNIAQEVQELRSDGSIFSKSILSGISPTYDRLVQTYYDGNGNITREITFALTYNANNKVIKKEVVS